MGYSLKDRFAFWIERFHFLDRLTLKYDGVAPQGKKRYVNRINGHLVVR